MAVLTLFSLAATAFVPVARHAPAVHHQPRAHVSMADDGFCTVVFLRHGQVRHGNRGDPCVRGPVCLRRVLARCACGATRGRAFADRAMARYDHAPFFFLSRRASGTRQTCSPDGRTSSSRRSARMRPRPVRRSSGARGSSSTSATPRASSARSRPSTLCCASPARRTCRRTNAGGSTSACMAR